MVTARANGSLRAVLGALVAAAVVLLVTPSAGASAPGVPPDAAARTAPTAPTARTARAPQAAEASRTPLRVVIDTMSPSYLPRSGNVVVTGTVTNRSQQTWSTVKLYAFFGAEQPLTNEGQLAAAAELPADEYAGDRLTDVGEPGYVEQLDPGASVPFTVRVPASALTTPEGGGVYWFGVHALGTDEAGTRDSYNDGLARTFLPYVPPRRTTPVDAALVATLSRAIPHRADGSLAQPDAWRRSLSPGGRLRDLLSFAEASGSVPLTWLVDPALPDAAQELAAGNPARSVEPSTATGEPPSDDPTSGSSEPSPSAGSSSTADQEAEPADPSEAAAAEAARGFLDQLGRVLPGSQVLTLPYGDVDAAGAVRHAPELLDLARAQSSEVLTGLGVPTTPALTSPSGYVSTEEIDSADEDTTVLATDRMLPDPAPGVADVDGHPVVVTSDGAASGGPRPGAALTTLGLRQRILAEAAVRAIKRNPRPLTVVLPTDADLSDPGTFFGGLDVPWLSLGTVDDVAATTAAAAVDPDELDYPPVQARRALDAPTFGAATDLVDSAEVLQRVLVDNATVAGQVTEEALATVSYAQRGRQEAARASLAASQDWIDDQLDGITVTAADGVTLSSDSGKILVIVGNRLDQPVEVRVEAQSDADIDVPPSRLVRLAPQSRTNLLLDAATSTSRVHNVTLLVTDADGQPLGATTDVPVRSAQVSNVIWLIMGTGAGLLLLAILVRLRRRLRDARAQGAGDLRSQTRAAQAAREDQARRAAELTSDHQAGVR